MSEEILRGSCLCGAVTYQVSGEVQRFVHCHCQRCRKATGSAHASNLLVKADGVTWLTGESATASYKVPAAERFATVFCTHCGSLLPRSGPGMVVVPAGSLDSEPATTPQARIFWESRAAWSCEAGGLPVFSEYPES